MDQNTTPPLEPGAPIDSGKIVLFPREALPEMLFSAMADVLRRAGDYEGVLMIAFKNGKLHGAVACPADAPISPATFRRAAHTFLDALERDRATPQPPPAA